MPEYSDIICVLDPALDKQVHGVVIALLHEHIELNEIDLSSLRLTRVNIQDEVRVYGSHSLRWFCSFGYRGPFSLLGLIRIHVLRGSFRLPATTPPAGFGGSGLSRGTRLDLMGPKLVLGLMPDSSSPSS